MSKLNDLHRPACLDEALAAMAAVVGAEHLASDPATRERYARSTAALPVLPLAVVRPANADEIAQLVKLAARFALAVYPISTGKNWAMATPAR